MATSGVLKITVFLNALSQGWSENFYVPGTDPIAWLYGAVGNLPPGTGGPNVESYLAVRQGLSPPLVGINAIRAALDGQPHVAGSIDFGLPGYLCNFSKLVSNTALLILPPYNRVLVKTYFSANGATLSANHYLGGLPSALQTVAAGFFPDPDWIKIFQNYAAWMKGMQAVARTRPLASAAVPVTAFVPSADGLTAQVSPVPAGITAPGIYSVLLRAWKIPHGWGGQHRATATTVSLAATPPYITVGPLRKAGVTEPAWTPANPGTVALMTPSYPTITRWSPQRIVKKDTGRPFGVPRGRLSRS